MGTPVDTFQRHFRYTLQRGRNHDVVCVLYSGGPGNDEPSQPQVSASVALVPGQRSFLVRPIRIDPGFQQRAGAIEQHHDDIKSLRHIYSRIFPLPYAAAMAGALAHASNRGCQRLHAYLSRDEVRILPRLFPLQHRGEHEYQGETRKLLSTAAERMPVLYELICIASRELAE
ncbi:MAG: hypothetical protein ACOCZF_02140 [Halorhodospira sp.]